MRIPISSLTPGQKMLNLGLVIEVTKLPDYIEVIVFKMNQKLVLMFLKDEIIHIADAT